MFEDAIPPKAKNLIAKISPIIREASFYLAGGTGLALQIGHRISEDLDLFKNSLFNENLLVSNLKEKVQSVEGIFIEKQTVSAFLDGVRCSFFFYDIPLCFETVRILGIEVAGWQDIVAEKFKTISLRGSKKDFFDIFAAIKMKHLAIEEAVCFFKKRFEATGLNRYHILRSLTFFEDAEGEPDPMLIGESRYGWTDVKAFFVKNVKEFEKSLMR